MALLETRSTTLSVVLRMDDTFTGARPFGELNVRLVEHFRRPIYHPEGYVLFVDLPEDDYTLQVSARYYDLYETIIVHPANLDPLNAAVPVPLVPNASYPFPENATLLRGLVRDSGGQPLAGVEVRTENGQTVFSDARGRYVLFFDLPAAELALLTLAKTGYRTLDESITVVPGRTVELVSDLVLENDPNTAGLLLTVTDPFGDPVTQALVEIPAYAKSDRTGLDGRAGLFVLPAQASETVTVHVNQQGFHEAVLNVLLSRGQTANAAAALNLNITHDTATLRVRTKTDGTHTPGVLVEVLEKNRAALSSPNDSRARFFFDDLAGHREDVSVRCSMNGFVEKTTVVEIRKHHIKNKTIDLDPA